MEIQRDVLVRNIIQIEYPCTCKSETILGFLIEIQIWKFHVDLHTIFVVSFDLNATLYAD